METGRLTAAKRYSSLVCALIFGSFICTVFSSQAHAWDTAQMSKLERFEQQSLGKNNYDLALDARLSQVETKLFGSAGSGSIKHRLTEIERKLDPSAVSDQDEPQAKPAMPEHSKASVERDLKPQRKESQLKDARNHEPANTGAEAAETASSKPRLKPGGLSIDSAATMSKPMFYPPQALQ